MSLLTIFFAAILVVVNSASIPLSVRQATNSQSFSVSPSPSPSIPVSSSSSIPAAANQLSARTTPSPSPSQSLPESPYVTLPQISFPGPSAQAPSSVGKFLGRVGVETPEFRSECLKCCRHTVRDHSNVLPVLRSCQVCALNENLAPQNSGNCKQGATLGFTLTRTGCFYDRCHKMLQSRSNGCMCLG